MSKEIRCFNIPVEIRALEENPQVKRIGGYAALYDSPSDYRLGYNETIAPGAFDNCDFSDVRVLFNHEDSQILGRTKSNTVRLRLDAKGLYYECDLPNTTLGNDIYELVKRGDISQSSFGFLIDKQEWSNDFSELRILKISQVVDVSPVTIPVYPDTTVAQRNLDEAKKQKEEREFTQFLIEQENNAEEEYLSALEAINGITTK